MTNNEKEVKIFGVSKVSPKGQIVIPADLRAELGINTGDQLVIAKTQNGDGILILKAEILNKLICGIRYIPD